MPHREHRQIQQLLSLNCEKKNQRTTVLIVFQCTLVQDQECYAEFQERCEPTQKCREVQDQVCNTVQEQECKVRRVFVMSRTVFTVKY